MSRLKPTPEIQAILIPKELLLYQAKQTPAAYILPCFFALVGLLMAIPAFWEIMPKHIYENPLFEHAENLFLTQHFSLVLVAFSLAAMARTHQHAKNYLHFITNYRVVERDKGMLHNDLQFILLHRIKFLKVKRGMFGILTQSGKIIIEDDKNLEHIEMDAISHPDEFKRAISLAKDRFNEIARVAESSGQIKQVQSPKTKRLQDKKEREIKRKKDSEALRQKRRLEEEELRKRNLLEEEERKRREDETGY